MTASAARSVALLTHSAHPKEGNCSMFSVRGSCKCLSAGLYRFLLRPFLLHLLRCLSRQHLLRGVSLFVCLSIVWIALTCEALGQYLCTTLCQCAKCRRRSRRWRSRWSCRCRRVLSPARSLSPELCLVRWVALNIVLLMSKSWMEEQLRLCPDCLVARKVSWAITRRRRGEMSTMSSFLMMFYDLMMESSGNQNAWKIFRKIEGSLMICNWRASERQSLKIRLIDKADNIDQFDNMIISSSI